RTARLPSKREPQGFSPLGISSTQSSAKNDMMRSRSCALKAAQSAVSVEWMSISTSLPAPLSPPRCARNPNREVLIAHGNERVGVVSEADDGADGEVVGAEIVGLGDRERLFEARHLDDEMGDLAEIMPLHDSA